MMDYEDSTWPEYVMEIDDILKNNECEEDGKIIAYFKEVQAVVERLIETKHEHFSNIQERNGVWRVRSESLTGKKFLSLLSSGQGVSYKRISFVNSHPYVNAFHTAIEELDLNALDECGDEDHADRLNTAVEMIREKFRGHSMRKYMHKQEKAKRGRSNSAQKLINSLREKYARIEVLRLDLSYRKGKYVDLDDFLGALKEVKEHWNVFHKDLVSRALFSGYIGCIAKLEYGILSGFHFHLLVFCDGSKHREDITLAKMLGDHWVDNVVPDNEGRYYNCNRNKNDYRYLGIGTLNYYDQVKYSYLMSLVIEYMVKTDHIMANEAPG
ncbi:MAG: hypothetical protein ACQEUY_15120, partial [Pseudomonadota bacterium]